MDPFRVCLALGPVAMYMLLLGAVNLSRRPLLATGVRDAATLAVALSGLVVIGPMELLFPFEAAMVYGPFVWLMLLALYAMFVVLWLLLLRPRLVIYNITADKLRPILAEVVERLDAEARWAGDSLTLPTAGVQLYVDGFAALRCVSLVSAGGHQSHAGWRRLETELQSALDREESGRNPHGVTLVVAGLLLIAAVIWAIAQNPQAVAQSLLDIARELLKMVGM